MLTPRLPAALATLLAARAAHRFAAGEALLDPGAAPRRVWLVRDGLVRIYSLDVDGREHTHAFAGADEWVVGRLRWQEGEVCCSELALGARALTPCLALAIEVDELARWRRDDPAAAAYLIEVLLGITAARLQREAALGQQSAEQRYRALLQRHPALLEQVPLREIAALLAITPVALSRIRRRLRDA